MSNKQPDYTDSKSDFDNNMSANSDKCESCSALPEEYEHSGCCPRGNNQCPFYSGRWLDNRVN